MFMPKKPVSLTLEQDNLVWLRGRLAAGKWRSLSEVLDSLVTAARTGNQLGEPSRSVAGTVDIASNDPDLSGADAYVRSLFDGSLGLSVDREGSASPRRSRRRRG